MDSSIIKLKSVCIHYTTSDENILDYTLLDPEIIIGAAEL